MSYADYIPNLKAMLDVREVFDFYGIHPNAKGFVQCPFHSERTASCKVYQDGFKCFGCGAHGDVVDFIQEYFNLNKYDACQKLNDDFRLGFPFETKANAFDILRAKLRQEQAQKRKDTSDKLYEEYWKAHDECMLYRDYISKHKPAPDEEPSPAFIAALKKVGFLDYKLDQAEVDFLNAFITK